MRKLNKKFSNPKDKQRLKRRLTIRKKVNGTTEKLRLCITKSNSNILVQAIDDSLSRSLFTVSTFGKSAVSEGCTIESALKVGAQVATELKKRHLSTAVFDRAGYKYTGVVSAVANSIRENGISI